MAKDLNSQHPFRAAHEITCAVTDCGASLVVIGPVVPPGWIEVKEGLICPRHKARIVVEDTTPDDVYDEAVDHQP